LHDKRKKTSSGSIGSASNKKKMNKVQTTLGSKKFKNYDSDDDESDDDKARGFTETSSFY